MTRRVEQFLDAATVWILGAVLALTFAMIVHQTAMWLARLAGVEVTP